LSTAGIAVWYLIRTGIHGLGCISSWGVFLLCCISRLKIKGIYAILVKFYTMDIGRYVARKLAKEQDGRSRELYSVLCQ
jgi:hypothetical protein